MTGSATELDVFECPLDGVNLIEASAGTGKTWNLCGLVLRLLLERGLEVQRILVVTFTNAATAELRERVRQRIVDTLAHLGGRDAGGDPFVPRLLGALRRRPDHDEPLMRRRLELALATFDEAAIFTIHGFCQRALSDTPFASRMPLDVEVLPDDSELRAEAANDFWRRRVAGDDLDPGLAAWLLERNDSPERFGRLLQRHLGRPTAQALWPRGIDAVAAPDRDALQHAHRDARALWVAGRDAVVRCVHDALSTLRRNIYKPEAVQLAAAQWDALLGGTDAMASPEGSPDKLDLLGSERLQRAARTGCRPPGHAFFAAAQALLDLRARARQASKLARLALLRQLLDEGSRALRDGKRQRRVLGYDDLLFNLHQRLAGDGGTRLAAALRERFAAALIDEFQDTDPLQFAIFDAIYRGSTQPLFLIGDPKQAIYSFRNADLHTYLRARAHASAAYTLVHNQRSTDTLLRSLNGLFGANPQAFMLTGLDYRPVTAGARPRPALVDATEPRAALQVWSLPEDDDGAPLLLERARQAAADAVAAEVARLLGAALRGQVTLDGRPLRAGDLALLVRTHAEGSRARQALARLGVGSVELSQDSVFRSPDAEELERVLAAVLEPTRERLLKAALATEAMGFDAAQIDALSADEPRLQALVQRFAGYRDAWLRRGVGFMLRRWLGAEQVSARLLARADGERRLTNLLHLTDCLQQAAPDHPAPDALLHWLHSKRRDERADDATQLRLESDRNLVQIVTIHKAKGLEYPIVFCPFLWQAGTGRFSDDLDGVAYHDDAGDAVVDYRKDVDDAFDEDDVKRRTRLEDAAETMRLIYVALTRAIHRCVLVAGCYRTGRGKSASAAASTRSLLNWLVAGAGQSPQEWFEGKRPVADVADAWSALAARCAPHLALAPLPSAPGQPLPAAGAPPELLAARTAPPVPEPWSIGSYSALVHGATHEGAAADHDQRDDDAAADGAADGAPDEDDILHFPRGQAAGVCLHAVFEHADFGDPASWPAAIEPALRRLRPAPHDGAAAPRLEAMLRRLLADVLATPLPVATGRPLRLADLPRDRRLTELEFHLPTGALAAAPLNELLRAHGYAAPRLAFAPLQGYLKGFIDLVFEHDGRYFVLDWKSNHLGHRPADYAAPALADVMARHGYHLQSLLYGVALDRHLRRRLPQYRTAEHFGGVVYLFVRGVRPGWTDAEGRPAGLHFHRPAPAVLQALAALLEAGEVPA